MKRILVVEDNINMRRGLRDLLTREGYEVTAVGEGPAALDRVGRDPPDVVLLDLMLPGMDGARVLRAVRAAGQTIPILVLTARASEHDKVLLLELGADDYVTKPFGRRELTARIAAILRRAHPAVPHVRAPTIVCAGNVVIDTQTREVLRDGCPVDLAPKEFDLLLALAQRRGVAASRRELLAEVWQYDATVVSRTVDLHVFELRRKLEDDPARPNLLLTVRKVGYRLKMDLKRDGPTKVD